MAKRRHSGGGFGGPAGMGGGMPNQAALMRQIQKAQEEMEAAQEALETELEEHRIEVSVGGGAVTVVINGHQKIQAITINKDVLDLEDEEWLTDLQDLLLVAVNQAVEQSQQFAAEKSQGMADNFKSMLPPLPGLGGLFG
jgi:hypothetical protein